MKFVPVLMLTVQNSTLIPDLYVTDVRAMTWPDSNTVHLQYKPGALDSLSCQYLWTKYANFKSGFDQDA